MDGSAGLIELQQDQTSSETSSPRPRILKWLVAYANAYVNERDGAAFAKILHRKANRHTPRLWTRAKESTQRRAVDRVRHMSADELYNAISAITSNRLQRAWIATQRAFTKGKRANYISMEWLMGPTLEQRLQAVGLLKPMQRLLSDQLLEKVLNFARDLGLGNGGLGRLAACFIAAAADMGLNVGGYGLWFRNGFFHQKINAHGQQEDKEDPWLETNGSAAAPTTPTDVAGNPFVVRFGGKVVEKTILPNEQYPQGYVVHELVDTLDVTVTAHDLPVPSQNGQTVLTLRLWNVGNFDAKHFLSNLVQKINDRLYPDDKTSDGPKLRLMQEYFLTSASVQDIITRHERQFGIGNLGNLAETSAIQLNDTHPAIAIPELMIQLHDKHQMKWEDALAIVREVYSYTNHTLAPEALETWTVGMLKHIAPRHLEIMIGLNNELMSECDRAIATGTIEESDRHAVSLITNQDGHNVTNINIHNNSHDDCTVHMGRMAAAFSKRTNGVSKMHSGLVKKLLFPALAKLGRVLENVTNGIDLNRWLQLANPELAAVIAERVGKGWATNYELLIRKLKGWQNDAPSLTKLGIIKRRNKMKLARLIQEKTGVVINPDAMIDCHVKRFHEYKRQFLNVLQTVDLYLAVRDDPHWQGPDVVKLFAGKAAPGYPEAKDCINVTNWLAGAVNNDPKVRDKLKIVFMPDYSVSLAENIIAGSDLSEQISTMGMEASGTGNMKFALNGAPTIGTLDGANAEIHEKILELIERNDQIKAEDCFFSFGMSVEEVAEARKLGPEQYKNKYVDGDRNRRVRNALESLRDMLDQDGNPPEIRRLAYLANNILGGNDWWMVAADFNGYCAQHEAAQKLYQKPMEWLKASLINIQAGAYFSATRAMEQYARWWGTPTYANDNKNNLAQRPQQRLQQAPAAMPEAA